CRVWGLQGESVYRYYVILTISIRIMLIVSLLPMPVVQVSNPQPGRGGDCFTPQNARVRMTKHTNPELTL
ncbi:MAG: hypothetical protein ROW48_06310, partial [Bellilinea sp.]